MNSSPAQSVQTQTISIRYIISLFGLVTDQNQNAVGYKILNCCHCIFQVLQFYTDQTVRINQTESKLV